MKKYFTFLLITFIMFTAISCDDKECDCDPKAHLGIGETCSCDGTGCTCTEQTAVIAGTSIPIRKQSGVTITQMNDAVEKINNAYGIINPSQKVTFGNKVSEIRITSGSASNFNTGIWNVGYNVDGEDLKDYILDDVVNIP